MVETKKMCTLLRQRPAFFCGNTTLRLFQPDMWTSSPSSAEDHRGETTRSPPDSLVSMESEARRAICFRRREGKTPPRREPGALASRSPWPPTEDRFIDDSWRQWPSGPDLWKAHPLSNCDALASQAGTYKARARCQLTLIVE